jgi:hypothetical protein
MAPIPEEKEDERVEGKKQYKDETKRGLKEKGEETKTERRTI